MTPAETTRVLAACASFDQRTVGDFDTMAWHKAIGNLDFTDAVEAVARYYTHTRQRIMPSDVVEGVKQIRNERAQQAHHEILALPSRFEPDPERDQRIEQGVRQGVHELVARWAMPDEDSGEDPVHAAALHRARRERGRRDNPALTKRRTGGGPGIQLDKVTRSPEWADDKAREATAIATLHAAGRLCGRRNCPTCTALAEVIPIRPTEPA
jgi:hypothetical protein